jgi:two-component system, chemotaxis family, chemotaxis protein CheY
MVVMVVEDSPTMRQLICYGLRRIEGMVVVEAADGLDGLAKLAEIKPDVILTDLNMPNMDGFAFIEQVRARADMKHIPVIILTTQGALPDQKRAQELAVATFVTKPIRGNAVVDAVMKVLGKQ